MGVEHIEIYTPPNYPKTVNSKYGTLVLDHVNYSWKTWLTKQNRIFYTFCPKDIPKNNVPVLLLFHGTDETAFETELLTQNDGKQSWLELACKENIILVFPQSRGAKCVAEKLKKKWFIYGWQPGDQDVTYVYEVLEAVKKKFPCIDKKRIYAVGFSNGGLFMSDVIVKMSESFAAICNYMGGLDRESKIDFSKAQRKVPLLIITGTRDENAHPCERAKEEFTKAGYDVQFKLIPDAVHAYRAVDTPEVWSYLKKYTLPTVNK